MATRAESRACWLSYKVFEGNWSALLLFRFCRKLTDSREWDIDRNYANFRDTLMNDVVA